jgi:uncharacterized repeat protein (TIGR01451 family)
VSVTDIVSSIVPGRATAYAVTVHNDGPSAVSSISLTEQLPTALRNVLYVTVGGTYNPATHLWSGLSLASGRTAILLVGGIVDPAATGTLVNAVSVAPPAGTVDTNPANNSASDTDTLTPQADLSVTVTDGLTNAVPGRSVSYTLTVRNNGPSTVSGFSLTDSLATTLGAATFTPSAGTYVSATHLWSGLSLASGQAVTMTFVGTIPPSATGKLANTVTVAPVTGCSDPVASNNSATDTDTLTPQADLSITKTDGITTVSPGGTTTYSIAVTNTGPSSLTGATVKDTLPAAITSDTWSASNGTSGSGNVNATVSLAAGATVTYTVVAKVGASATGSLTNTATVASPSGVPDTNTGNNSATDTDTLVPQADLSITKSDGTTTATAGGLTTYSIVVSNAGPVPVTGATVTDVMPGAIGSDTWTASNGASGTGNIGATVSLAVGASVTYSVVASVGQSATGSLSNTASVAVPSGINDPNSANNSATDTDVLTQVADLSATVTDGASSVSQGAADTYTVIVSNGGPAAVSGASVSDVVPAAINGATWSATASAGSSVADATGTGDIASTVSLLPGGSATYTLTGFVDGSATGDLSDSATVGVPAGVIDSNLGNNSASDTDSISTTTASSRLRFGDLTLCNVTGLGKIGNPTVREFFAIASRRLGGVSSTSTPSDLDTIAADLNGAFDAAPSQFALDHLSLSSACTPVAWKSGDLTTYAQGDFGVKAGPVAMTDYDFANVYTTASSPFGALVVGDTDPGRATMTFGDAGAVLGYLPADGTAGALDSSSFDPTTTSAGVFGGDMVALKLNIDFSDSYVLPTCPNRGTGTCPWGIGDLVTYGQGQWSGDASAARLLSDGFGFAYDGDGPRGFAPSIGTGAFSISFNGAPGLQGYFPADGVPDVLTETELNPTSTSSGVFGGDVTGLRLDVDFSDAGLLPGASSANFADLTLCNISDLPGLDGMTVRQVEALAEGILGGGDTTYTPAQIDTDVSRLATAFVSGEVTDMASHLVIGACP